jgi:L-threonylcarbamoyladenylate synthase
MSPIVPATPDQIERAAIVLRQGGVVALPTETVYGLGANAFDELAVARVFEIKGRPRFDPLIVHVAELPDLDRLVTEVPAIARRLMERFWPGPLTLVLPKTSAVPDLVTSGGPTVAIRMPDHEIAQAIIRAAGVPIAAPSANSFGRISPTTAAHVADQLGADVDLIVDGGPCRVGVESTVLAVAETGATLLRPGGTSVEEIEAVIGPIEIPAPLPVQVPGEALVSPGTLPQHYAPRTPLQVNWSSSTAPESGKALPAGRLGWLAFRTPEHAAGFERIEVLSPAGDLREAAAHFFAALRRLDASGLDLIVADSFPMEGLGRALNDRLRRAEHS